MLTFNCFYNFLLNIHNLIYPFQKPSKKKMAQKEKEGKQSRVSELKPWPAYIDVRCFKISIETTKEVIFFYEKICY